jgi:uncharacterized protein YdeI (YjbR/CyaY-like superfamily)
LEVPDLVTWRRWLDAHHDSDRAVWLVFNRKATGAQCVAYEDALDEALCWGWIDSIVRNVDEGTYVRKFTRRTNPEKWSVANLRRLRRLLTAGRVQPSGLAAVSESVLRRATSADAPPPPKNEPGMPSELVRALDDAPAAKRFFDTLAPSYRRNYVLWVSSAKQPATRERRATEAARRLSNRRKDLLK